MRLADAGSRVAEEAVYQKGGYPALIRYKISRVYYTVTSCCQ